MQDESSGFVPLALRLKPGSPFLRYLFLKPHKSDGGHLPKDRTLFVAGLPHNFDEDVLAELLAVFGAVDRVALHSSKMSALVLFKSDAGRDKALQAAKDARVLDFEMREPDKPYGLKGWVEQHKAMFPGNAVLQKQLDDWFETFEAEEERKRTAAAASTDDGWTVVTRQRGRNKTNDASGATVGGVSMATAEAAAGGKKAQQLTDFYRFQQRERKQSELVELRRKFQEDKQRIAELKASRRFKPY
ncbi:hypothetical protein WJX72_003897 [[Myrmecia] bisecta]|uniref:RRM domain-containing protein n=1 Tax=[Myrmecia] bisecta TaxID=41462 RepID=A0AAW1PNU1_9CHLO